MLHLHPYMLLQDFFPLIFPPAKPLPTTQTCINCLGDSKKIFVSENTPKFQKLIKNIYVIIEEYFIWQQTQHAWTPKSTSEVAESVILLHKKENTFSLHYKKKKNLSLRSSSPRPGLQAWKCSSIFNSGSSHTAIRFNSIIFCRIWLLHILFYPKEFSCAIGRY